MRTRTLRQTATFPAPPEEVYRALMTSQGHTAFTGATARISPKVGGRFTAWDGYITGVNIELVPPRRIVQKWRPQEEGWPEDHYSTVTFVLTATPQGTRLTFTHAGVVAEHAGHLAAGWREHYWGPLREYLTSA